MDRVIKSGIVLVAGAFALTTLGIGTAIAGIDDPAAKRDDEIGQVVVTEEDDDNDDSGDDTSPTGRSAASGVTATGNTDLTGNSGLSRDSGVSAPSNDSGTRAGQSALSADATNSRVTSVTRDRDRSRGDLTRDLTNDGPGRNNVDDSRHSTNDKSRNDTR